MNAPDPVNAVRIWSIANQKGGVGKSTVTVNLAAALTRKGQRVLVVDLDPQGTSTGASGIKTPRQPYRNLAHVFLDDEKLRNVIQSAPEWGFDIAPSHIHLAKLEGRWQPGDVVKLRKHLQDLPEYDHIVIDSPPSLGIFTYLAMVAATNLVIVTEPSSAALEALESFMETYTEARELNSDGLPIAGVIVNLYDPRTNESQSSYAELQQAFGSLIWEPPIHRRVVLAETRTTEKSLYSANKDGTPGLINLFEDLADRMINYG